MSRIFSIMTTSIMTTIDLNKLDKEIREYKMSHRWDEDPYIFMNENTAKAIEDKVSANNVVDDNNTLMSKIKNIKSVYAIYTGYNIFINNEIKFGIVEIR